MTKRRRILAVTGIRSEYDIMSSVYRAISERAALELQVVVTGAHLSDAYGFSVQEIRNDGFTIVDEIESLLSSDRRGSRVKGLGIQLQGLTQTIERVRPDILLVLGDREEAMATALVGAYANIAVAHVAGGDRVVGNVDDQVRHAVSKLAHIHLVTNAESAERLLHLGEQPFRVHNVGNPGLDRLLSEPELSVSQLSSRLGFPLDRKEPFLLLIQHVLSSEMEHAYEQMRTTLLAVKELGIRTVLSYPNSDAGSQQTVRALREFEREPWLYTAKNIPRSEFVNLMRKAACLVGNSSAGILEAPLLRLPVVNVGNRQQGRLHADNVQFVPHDVAAIRAAVQRAVRDEAYRTKVAGCANPYGDGKSSARIADILASVQMDSTLLVKDITY